LISRSHDPPFQRTTPMKFDLLQSRWLNANCGRPTGAADVEGVFTGLGLARTERKFVEFNAAPWTSGPPMRAADRTTVKC
jgi:hypothetical protein